MNTYNRRADDKYAALRRLRDGLAVVGITLTLLGLTVYAGYKS